MKIGFTCGAWDLLHPGHILHLEESRAHCDYLIVGLHVDPSNERPGIKNRPVQTLFERFVQLNGCRHVDKIVPYETNQDLLNILATQPINIRFLDESYGENPSIFKSLATNPITGGKIVGKQLCINKGIEFHYTKRAHSYSSTELRNRTNVTNQNTTTG